MKNIHITLNNVQSDGVILAKAVELNMVVESNEQGIIVLTGSTDLDDYDLISAAYTGALMALADGCFSTTVISNAEIVQ